MTTAQFLHLGTRALVLFCAIALPALTVIFLADRRNRRLRKQGITPESPEAAFEATRPRPQRSTEPSRPTKSAPGAAHSSQQRSLHHVA